MQQKIKYILFNFLTKLLIFFIIKSFPGSGKLDFVTPNSKASQIFKSFYLILLVTSVYSKSEDGLKAFF